MERGTAFPTNFREKNLLCNNFSVCFRTHESIRDRFAAFSRWKALEMCGNSRWDLSSIDSLTHKHPSLISIPEVFWSGCDRGTAETDTLRVRVACDAKTSGRARVSWRNARFSGDKLESYMKTAAGKFSFLFHQTRGQYVIFLSTDLFYYSVLLKKPKVFLVPSQKICNVHLYKTDAFIF